MSNKANIAVALVFAFGLTGCTTSESSPTLFHTAAEEEANPPSTSSDVPVIEISDATKLNAEQGSIAKKESRKIELMKQQIHMLERAVGAKTPEKAIETWAEAVKTRNGALQYAMIYPDKRASHLKMFEECNWVTGTSSPWMERYRIDKGTKKSNGSYEFKVQFDYRTSDDANKKIAWADIDSFDMVVRKSDGYWYVVEE